MASGRDSPNLSTVVSGLHLIFTLTSVAFFTYKLYYLENELSLIRREVPFRTARESAVIKAAPPNMVQSSEEQRSGRNRRAGKRKSESSSAADKLKAVCVQKLLNNVQVCNISLFWTLDWDSQRESKSRTKVHWLLDVTVNITNIHS